MIKELVKYPTPLSLEYGIDVRTFDEKLFSLIDDLKDTINENNLDGLSAFQIGNYFNVIVVKDNDNFIELINPRVISQNSTIVTKESTTYFFGKEAEVKRFENITVVYQDRTGQSRSLNASGKLAVVLQRKIDYTFGATFILKMSEHERARFERTLESGLDIGYDDYCPTTFQRDKILFFTNMVVLAMFLATIISFFLKYPMWDYMLYASGGVSLLNFIYLFYGLYEGKKYTSCVSCQLGNLIGTTAISFVRLSIVMVIAFFLLK